MKINKKELIQAILTEIICIKDIAETSAKQAHDTATHAENAPESRYDTLGLEGAYLAHGQTQRVVDCEADIDAFQKIETTDFGEGDDIRIGALAYLIGGDQASQYLFLSPTSGGVKIQFQGVEVALVTPLSPMGKALLGKHVDDDIELDVAGQKKAFLVAKLY